MAIRRYIRANDLAPELSFSTSTSSGPGGQNVNRVQSRVTLRFDLAHSALLNEDEKQLLLEKLKPRLTSEGVLLISAQEKRSQLQNREAVVLKLEKMLEKALTKRKARKPTIPTKASRQERIQAKKQRSEKKKWRQKPL